MTIELPSDCQERYDYVIEFIDNLPIDSYDKKALIYKIDDLVYWIITSESD